MFDVFERDCSVQRRHQKILEEAPSNLDRSKSEEIREKARIAAQAVGYSNAGTVEFLMDKTSGDFYFMEMNTRLQVEHPVSEMVSGLDLVELQLRVAKGENIAGFMAGVTKPKGHAIEARICAEDWYNGFLPQFGSIDRFSIGGRRVADLRESWADYDVELISKKGAQGEREGTSRIDLGFGEGSTVSQFYDSMIGKVIVWGPDREESLRKLEQTLDQFRLMGIETNIPFIRGVLKQPKFKDFSYSLDFFSEVHEEIIQSQGMNPIKNKEVIAAVASQILHLGSNRLAQFRVNQTRKKYLRLECDRAFGKSDSPQAIELEVQEIKSKPGLFNLQIFSPETESLEQEVTFKITKKSINEHESKVEINFIDSSSQSQHLITLEKIDGNFLLFCEGQYWKIKNTTLRESRVNQEEPLNKEYIICPMSGVVSKLLVAVGDQVKKGDPILSVEAMKMEHKIFAGFDLEVVELRCKENQFVDLGEAVVKIREI